MVLKFHLKQFTQIFTQIYDSLFQKFSITFIYNFSITISEELSNQFVFLSPPHFLKLYMHYTYIYWTSYFDLIVGRSVVLIQVTYSM